MTAKEIEKFILKRIKYSEPMKLSFQMFCELLKQFQDEIKEERKENFVDAHGHFGAPLPKGNINNSPFQKYYDPKGEISTIY